jgi:peptidoglycan-N-acetylglucosamine deacetylase
MTPKSDDNRRAILTVDFEDWFHVDEPALSDPSAWRDLPSDIERETIELLDLLDEYSAKATFFVLGWLAERVPDTVREIARRNHELGVHGYYHTRPSAMTEDEFRSDLKRCRDLVAGLAEVEVKGYRAPYFGVRDCPFPYLDILSECGFLYDSSIFPGIFPGRGQPRAPASPHEATVNGAAVWEVPISTTRLMGVPVAFAGGGFLRLLPAWFVRWGDSRLARQDLPTVYYIHPRDLNPAGRTASKSLLRRVRYYGGRRSVRRKLKQILESSVVTGLESFLACDTRPLATRDATPLLTLIPEPECVGSFEGAARHEG